MSLTINKNNQGKYIVISKLTNEKIHSEESLDENEIKKLLINIHFWNFIKHVIRIYIDFPNGNFINNQMVVGDLNGENYIRKAMESDNSEDLLFDIFLKAKKQLNLDFNIDFNE